MTLDRDIKKPKSHSQTENVRLRIHKNYLIKKKKNP